MSNENISMKDMSFKLTKDQAKNLVILYIVATMLMLGDGLLNIFGRYDSKKVEQHREKVVVAVKKVTNS